MGWEIRAILRIPMVQPMPMTPAYTTPIGRPAMMMALLPVLKFLHSTGMAIDGG
jgi:hypothetical protein